MKDRRQPVIKDSCFYNQENEKSEGFFFKSSVMLFKAWVNRFAGYSSNFNSWVLKYEPDKCCVNPTITWIGHSSFLIQINGVNILTDPVFGNFSFLVPRFLNPGISLDKIPNIDFVLISHNHRDHMDSASLIALRDHQDINFLVPKGDKFWFDSRSFVRVKESSWWEESSFKLKHDFSKKIKFVFLPAKHWSQRGIFDKNKSLWGSWLIECEGKRIYFAGDTSYWSHFSEIGKEFPDIDVALMPIGPCEPRKWIKHSHIDAQEACKGFLELGAKKFIPMHWGTFPLGTDHFESPILQLKKWFVDNKDKLSGKSMHFQKMGESIEFNCAEEFQDNKK